MMPPDFSFDNLLTNLAGDRFTNKPLQNTEFILAGCRYDSTFVFAAWPPYVVLSFEPYALSPSSFAYAYTQP